MAVGPVSTGGVAGATTAQSATTYEADRRYTAIELQALTNREATAAILRQNVQDGKAQVQALSDEIQALKRKPLTTVNDLEAVQGRIAAIEKQIQQLNTAIDFRSRQIDYLDKVQPGQP